jgi:hypothetical protein
MIAEQIGGSSREFPMRGPFVKQTLDLVVRAADNANIVQYVEFILFGMARWSEMSVDAGFTKK